MKEIYYPAQIEQDEDGVYVVSFTDFRGVTDGENIKEAYENAIELISDHFEALKILNEEIPVPSERKEGDIMIPYRLAHISELETLKKHDYHLALTV